MKSFYEMLLELNEPPAQPTQTTPTTQAIAPQVTNTTRLNNFQILVQRFGINHPDVKRFYQTHMNNPEMLQGMQKAVAAARQQSQQQQMPPEMTTQANKMLGGMQTQQQVASLRNRGRA